MKVFLASEGSHLLAHERREEVFLHETLCGKRGFGRTILDGEGTCLGRNVGIGNGVTEGLYQVGLQIRLDESLQIVDDDTTGRIGDVVLIQQYGIAHLQTEVGR